VTKVLKTFGDDLAFAGIDTVEIVGNVVSTPDGFATVEVRVKDGEANAVIPGFISVEQAEAAIAIAYAGSIKDAIVGYDNRWRFDFVVNLLSTIASLSYVLPTPVESDSEYSERVLAEQQAIDSYLDQERGL